MAGVAAYQKKEGELEEVLRKVQVASERIVMETQTVYMEKEDREEELGDEKKKVE